MNGMDPIRLAKFAEPSILDAAGGQQSDGRFADLIKEGFDKLDALEKDADEQVEKLLRGEPVELHRVVLAGEQAGLAFDLLMSVRNKVVDAYQEVMRMQV